MTKSGARDTATAQSVVDGQKSKPSAKASTSVHPLLALQRSIGNQATVALLQRQAVIQRDDDLEEGVEKTGGALDLSFGQISNFSSMGGIQDNMYQQGNVNTPGAIGGSVGSAGGGLTSLTGMALSSKQAYEAQQTKATEEQAGRKGEWTHREATRTHKTQTANAIQSAGNLTSAGLSTAGNISQVLANSGATSTFAASNNILGGAAGAVALPVQVVNTIRTIRKAYKQWDRVSKLGKKITDPKGNAAAASRALEDQSTIVDELATLKTDLEASVTEAEAARDQNARGSIPWRSMNQVVLERQVAVDAVALQHTGAVTTRDQLQTAKDKAVQELADATQRIKDGKEAPADIRAYAMAKNKAGFWKKVVSVVGGVLGIGGGIAATVASIAAIGATTVVATAVLATPVGWALCGAAAVIGLAMGGYAFWKWASKKYLRARESGMTRGRAFLAAINPFEKVGQSRRERNADRLYEYSAGNSPEGGVCTTEDRDEAREVLTSLGLNWSTLKLDNPTHKPAALKVIAAKMAS
ncbi:MAG: hypothetical protein ACRDZ8_08565 [Acidimicrobiales bacterium]